MTPEERINEISRECGLSNEVVRMVLKAEMTSAARSLAKGEHAVLLGRCIIKPRKRNGEVKLSCVASTSIMRELNEQLEELEESRAPIQLPHVKIRQLEGLY